MKILFIYPVPPLHLQVRRYQIGLGYISAFLKACGHKTRLYSPHRYEEKAIACNIDTFRPDLIGFSLTSNQVPLAFHIIDYIRSHYCLPIVIGGVHPTVAPEDCIHKEGVMGIVRGEGEEAMLELATFLEEGKDYTKIKNCWFKKNGQVIKNSPRPLLGDLDKLPFPDRELFGYQKLLHDVPQVEVMAGRGCPYKCSYCINPFLYQFSQNLGRFIRQRSVDNILKELEEITRTYSHIETILFHDDTFTLDPIFLKDFSIGYRKRFKIPFWCNTRADAIDREKLESLKQAGCSQINLGIESGNDFIRESVLGRDLSRSRIISTCRLAKKTGLKLAAFNMVGLPYETVGSIKETIELNKEIGPDSIFCSIFYPYPGTELYDLCKEKGWRTQKAIESFYEPTSVLAQPSIRAEEVTYYYEIFKGLVLYPGLSKLIRLMVRVKPWPGYSLYRLFQETIWFLSRVISPKLPFSLKGFIKLIIRQIRKSCR